MTTRILQNDWKTLYLTNPHRISYRAFRCKLSAISSWEFESIAEA
jgi:hypothetical protein